MRRRGDGDRRSTMLARRTPTTILSVIFGLVLMHAAWQSSREPPEAKLTPAKERLPVDWGGQSLVGVEMSFGCLRLPANNTNAIISAEILKVLGSGAPAVTLPTTS